MKNIVWAGLVGLAVLSVSSSSWGRSVSLDLRNVSAAKRAVAVNGGTSGADGTLRSFDLNAGVADVGEVAIGDELSFKLFDDVELTLKLVKKMSNPTGSEMFLAEAGGYDGIVSAIVLRNAAGLTVDMQDFHNDKVYHVISTPSGVKVVESEVTKGERYCLGPREPKLPEGEEATETTPARSPRLMAASGGNVYVDMLVAYDAAAKTWVDANGGGMQTFAETQVAKMNTALKNDGLDSYFTFRLVGVTSISQSDPVLSSALDKVTDGAWSSVRAKRDEVGADLVTMLVDTGSNTGNTGLGWTLKSNYKPISMFKENAYHTCAIRAVANDHTMTHEAGHNMGAGHSTADAIDTSKISPGPQYDSYSAGIYFTGDDGKQYHTIMAYNFDGKGNHYYGAPLFSSPYYSYKGTVAGDATHNNAQTLVNTYKAVSQFRAQVVPDGPDETELLDVEWTINDGVLTGVKLNGKTDITIPSSVTSIAANLFKDNTSLTSVTFPSTIEVCEAAFKGCLNLSRITFADGVMAFFRTSCFEGSGLTEVTLPANGQMGDYVFRNCANLKKAVMSTWMRDSPDWGEARLRQSIFPGCHEDLTFEYYWSYLTVEFNKNDGSGTKATQKVKAFNDDPLKTIAELGWTRDGYSFAGWGTSVSATEAVYPNGGMICKRF